jgi:hypothetical protein
MYDNQMRFLAASLLLLLPLCAQDKQEKGRRPMPNPTNLKVLKVTTGPEVIAIMRTYTAGLGVKCDFCHAQGNFASDDNPKKETARHMIAMMENINAVADVKNKVACFTCHRGESEPKNAPEAKPAAAPGQ